MDGQYGGSYRFFYPREETLAQDSPGNECRHLGGYRIISGHFDSIREKPKVYPDGLVVHKSVIKILATRSQAGIRQYQEFRANGFPLPFSSMELHDPQVDDFSQHFTTLKEYLITRGQVKAVPDDINAEQVKYFFMEAELGKDKIFTIYKEVCKICVVPEEEISDRRLRKVVEGLIVAPERTSEELRRIYLLIMGERLPLIKHPAPKT